MDNNSLHPVTTPKGAAIVTLLLAVLSVFAPFFASLVVAICLAVVAICIIIWIYWSEIESVKNRQSNGKVLIFPVGSIAAIVFMAVVVLFTSPPAPVQSPPLTLQDVERGVSLALSKVKTGEEKEVEPELPPDRSTSEYRFVIEEVPVAAPGSSDSEATKTPKLEAPNDLTYLIAKMNRRKLEFDALLQCDKERYPLMTELAQLENEAINAQNQFYKYDNPKQMVGDYNAWVTKVRDFLGKHKDKLPDTTVFDLATGEHVKSIFVGDGTRAWLKMEAKRKAVESIQTQLRAIPCDKISKAAIVECEESGECTPSVKK